MRIFSAYGKYFASSVSIVPAELREFRANTITSASLCAALSQFKSRARWNPFSQSIFDSAVDGIIVIDAKGLIKAFNPAAERLFGYRADEVLGQNVKLLMPSPDREQHDRYIAQLPEHEGPENHRNRPRGPGRRKDGSTFPLHLSVGEMELDGAAGVHGHPPRSEPPRRDREALRKSEERLRSIVESAVDGIIVIDDRGLIQAFNPSAERLFGYTVSDVLGRNVNMLMPSPDREQHDGYLRHYSTTGDQKIIGIGREVTGLRRTARRFPFICRSARW